MTRGHKARTTRPTPVPRRPGGLRRFLGNRAREAAYSGFFTTVFLACSPAHSLAVDDIRVLSRLGEPLVAEILVTPAAGETLNRGCFSTTSAAGDLPGTGRLRLSLSRSMNAQVLRVTSAQPVREPMSEFILQVKCPGVPTLVKNFLVMVDPPGASEQITTSAAAAPATLAPLSSPGVTARQASQRPQSSRARPGTGDIQPGSRYRVQPGDMLSTIADRVAGRPEWSVWPIAQQIYTSNPGAFLLGNPNVISQGATIYIPQLSEIDMSAATSQVRPEAARIPASKPTAAVQPQPAVAAVPARQHGSTPTAVKAVPPPSPQQAIIPIPDRVARILDAPADTGTPVIAVPAMQLTTTLFRESRVKMELRAQGMPVPPAVQQPRIVPQPEPGPQSQPDRPDSVANDSRAALQPGQAAQPSRGINWLWVMVGLLTGLLLGAMASAALLRRNLRREYDHDVREGVQRHIQVDRMRREREHEPGRETDTVATAAVAPVAPTMEMPRVKETPDADYTVEMGSMPGLDFEVAGDNEPTSDTVEVKAVSEGLDLELPNTGQTGQHEVDFELLERAYSEDVEFQNENAETATDDDTGPVAARQDDSYYHLENRDPADEAPLPIELGDDEMGDDDEDGEPKVVRFPH